VAETTESDIETDGPPAPPSGDELAGPTAAVDEADAAPDPHGLADLVGRLSAAAAESARAALAVLSVVLRDGEQVRDLAVGRLNGAGGVVALTDQRLVLTSDRAFKADAVEFLLAEGLEVSGWQDGDQATIVIVDANDSATLDEIIDRSSAQRLALGVSEALGD